MKEIRNTVNQNTKAKPPNSSLMVYWPWFNSVYPLTSLVCRVLLELLLDKFLKTEVLCYPWICLVIR